MGENYFQRFGATAGMEDLGVVRMIILKWQGLRSILPCCRLQTIGSIVLTRHRSFVFHTTWSISVRLELLGSQEELCFTGSLIRLINL